MFVAIAGAVCSGPTGSSYPPYGTLLSSHCSSYSSQDHDGNETYYDANGSPWPGMFTLWEQIADGSGGSYWQSLGANVSDINTACWYPYGYCLESSSGENMVNWNGCGSSGYFAYGSYSNSTYADGSGGTYGSGGGTNYGYTNGTIIYQSGTDDCCKVKFDGSDGYYTEDNCATCPPAGTTLGTGCQSTSGTDASGAYYEGAWNYGSFIADGSCGSYFDFGGSNISGCYFPAYWKFDYSSDSFSLHWHVDGDMAYATVAEGDFTYYSYWTSSNISDGNGGTYSDGYSSGASEGDLISSGTYYDLILNVYMDYQVYYDGEGGSYVDRNQTP